MGLRYLPKIRKTYDVKIINFVPQHKSERNSLIKMNCSIPKNSNKNLFTVHSEKKGKEKLKENKTNQMRSEKKLKIIKLNFK